MGRRKNSGSRIFLTELIIDILFFTVAAAVCLVVFVKADIMSRTSRENNQALVHAQQAAECFKSSGEDGLVSVLGAVMEEEGVYAVYYDEDFQPVEGGKTSFYAMRIFTSREDGMATARVLVERADAAVFEIEVKKYEG